MSQKIIIILFDCFTKEYSCCDPKLRKNWRCFSIDLNEDEFYGQYAPGRSCMDFTRSHVHCKNESHHKEQAKFLYA